MEHSETLGSLAGALSAAQKEYATIQKDKTVEVRGPQGNLKYSYAYADLSDVVEQCKTINATHGLSVSQMPGWDIVSEKHTLVTILMHSSGEWLSEEMHLPLTDSSPQGQGSGITYARRYAYCGILGIVADKDDDGQGAQNDHADSGKSEAAPPKATGTTKKSASTAQPPAQGEETGQLFDSRQRNKITKYLSALEPAVRGDDAVASHISTVLGLAEVTPLAALTQVEGEKLAGLLGVTL